MAQFKELTIRRTPNGQLPQLLLNGSWLEKLQFTTGTPVLVLFKESCLILTTFDLSTIKYTPTVLMVESKLVRNRPRTQLVLNGFLLKKYGFNVGDRVGLTLEHGKIQLTKINRYTTAEQTA